MSSTDVTKNHVALLWGGWADERDVSHSSAEAVAKALAEAGFEHVDMLDVADPQFVVTRSGAHYDVAYVAMHGAFGEDGCIQGLLEVLHIPYTFSGVLASAMGADKDVSKLLYEQAGIPVPRGLCVHRGEVVNPGAVVEELGLPLFIKPAVNGSSYGVTRVTAPKQIDDAVKLALESSDHALIEECVVGTEITVPVIGNEDARALPIVEVVMEGEFYDLKAKYEPSELHHVMPARLAPDVYGRAQELAVMAHQALGCAGCSRSDFIVKDDGTPVILETNTIPGMTERSLLPDSAAHDGIPFSELCRMFIEWALEAGH